MSTSKKIDGIFNYCDRWCERCTFTSRCAIYEADTGVPPEGLDLKNQAFWQRLGENLTKAQGLLLKAAAEAGVDLEAAASELQEVSRRKDALRLESGNHPLSILSLEYSKVGREWLKTQPGMLDRLETLKNELTLGIETEQAARQETYLIKESLAVIQWYLHFIHVKLARALYTKSSVEDRNDEYDYRGHDGSAKVALIAIERSMQAWSEIFKILPNEEDHFLKVLALLERIKTLTKQEFPGAEDFIRPGLDEEVSATV